MNKEIIKTYFGHKHNNLKIALKLYGTLIKSSLQRTNHK